MPICTETDILEKVMITCKRCGAENRQQRDFCKHCGVPLETGTPQRGTRRPARKYGQNVNVGTQMYSEDDIYDVPGGHNEEVFTSSNPMHSRNQKVAYVSGRMRSEDKMATRPDARPMENSSELRARTARKLTGAQPGISARGSFLKRPLTPSRQTKPVERVLTPVVRHIPTLGQPVPGFESRDRDIPTAEHVPEPSRPPATGFDGRESIVPDDSKETGHFDRHTAKKVKDKFPKTVINTPRPIKISQPSAPVFRHNELQNVDTVISAPLTSAAALVFLDSQGKEGDKLPLLPGRVIIGRTDGDVLFPNDPYMAFWHAQISYRKNGIFLKDMNTTNGVYLRLRAEMVLQDRDRFIIGNQLFEFRDSWKLPEAQQDGSINQGSRGFTQGTRILLIREGDEQIGVYLLGNGLSIGRQRGELLFPDDSSLDPEHASIRRFADGSCRLMDFNSETGVFLRIREEVEITKGDCFQIGLQRIRVD